METPYKMKTKFLSKFDITEFSSYKDIPEQYTDYFIKNSRCVKVSENTDSVTIAVSEDFKDKIDVLKEVHFPKSIIQIVVKDSDFVEFIGSFVDKISSSELSNQKEDVTFSLQDINSEAPVVNIINAICLEAIRKKASDIHIQGEKNTVAVRLRIDGVLQTVKQLDKRIFDSLISRIKVMSGLNVMESRLCQDGRMSVQAGEKKLDFRVSIVPAVAGQNIVLRLFNSESEDFTLEELGFSEANLKQIRSALKLPHGMILLTGPTGSGKTTTLHAMIKEMDIEHLKIVTIEDPVEKVIDGIEQIQVNEEIGLSFSNILRRILRQDPDVIMVGEIRDSETAELAVRSALTGHLILSTLHTNDSISSVTRLKNLGIEPYLISSILRYSIAQRLVRKVCQECHGSGCEKCNFTGFNGRTAIGEIFNVNENTAELIEQGASDSQIKKEIIKKGFYTLQDDALAKVKAGITTKEEISREGLL